MKKFLFLFLLISVFAVTGCGGGDGTSPSPGPSTVDISGKTVDNNGNAVAGASLATSQGVNTTSGQDGAFTFKGNSNSVFVISSSASGYKGSLYGSYSSSGISGFSVTMNPQSVNTLRPVVIFNIN